MIRIEIKNLEKLNRVTKGVSQIRVGMYGAIEKEMEDLGNRLVRQGKLNVTAGGPTGEGLHVRTGRLRASINAQIHKTDKIIQLLFGADTPYARIHEMGGETGRAGGRFIMKKRPYLAPAVEKEYPGFANRIKDILRLYAVKGVQGNL
jgi:phage gpG-like protein